MGIDKTSFGADSSDKSSFFTGKPYVEDLGYTFLLRNYRADMGKWLSQDLIGYPDGWNNFAYCNNDIVGQFDYLGLCGFLSHNVKYVASKSLDVYTGKIADVYVFTCYGPSTISKTISSNEGFSVNIKLSDIIPNLPGTISLTDSTNISETVTYTNNVHCNLTGDSVHEQIGEVRIELQVWAKVTYSWDIYECGLSSDPRETDIVYFIKPEITEEKICKTKQAE